MKKKSIIIRLGVLAVAAAMAFSSGLTPAAAKATPSGADPWGTAAMGPAIPMVSAEYSEINGVKKTEQKEREFIITAKMEKSTIDLSLCFPSVGGFRISNENKGYFNPESNYKIKYSETPAGFIELTPNGGDGTRIVYREVTDGFALDVYNSENIRLFRISSKQLIFGYSNEGELKKVQLEMPLSEKENIYGTGERFNEFNQVGRRLLMWNVDSGYHGNPTNPELWRGYKNVPILYSNRGYTLFYNSYYPARIDVGYTDETKYTMNFSGPEFDVYIWTGNSAQNLMSYTSLTGKSELLPKWAYSYIAGGGTNVWNSASGGYYGTAVKVMNEYKRLGTPNLAAVYIEGISEENANVYNLFKRTGTRVMRWNGPDTIPEETMALALPELSSEELSFARLNSDRTQKSGSFVDFSSPNAATVISRFLKKDIEYGCVGGLLDFGELVTKGSYFAGIDKTGMEMHNMFSYWYAKAYSDAFKQSGVDEYVFFSRSASAGSQKYSALFSGDQSTSYEGLREQVVAALSIGASGFSMWGGDLGGYGGIPSNELFARWSGFSAFSTINRAHGAGTRFPWEYGSLGETSYQKYYWMRENLLDKIYSSAIESSETGLPMMRALALAYPDNTDYADEYTSYMFCDDFLVTPSLSSREHTVDVTFPQGRWYNLWNGKMELGGDVKNVEAAVDEIAVYIRAGAVIPVTVAPSLELSDSLYKKDTVNALMVTAPDYDRIVTFRPDEKNVLGYKNTVLDNTTFRVTADKQNKASAILAKGVVAAAVKVDGKSLERFDKRPDDNSKLGYYVESDSSTVIYLTDNKWDSVDITLGEAKLENLAASATVSVSGANTAIDGDNSTSYRFPTTANNELIIELAKAKSLNNIKLKWTVDYAKSYVLEVSEDGESWTEVAAPEDSYGGIETILLNGKMVKFIKISKVVKGTQAAARIYEIEIYEDVLNPVGVQNGNSNLGNSVTDLNNVGNNDGFYQPSTEDQVIYKPGTKDKYRKVYTTQVILPVWAIVLICVGAVLLAGGAAVTIILVRKKKKAQKN